MAGLVNTQLPLPQPSNLDGQSIVRTLVGWANGLIQQLVAYGVRVNACLPKDGSEAMTGSLQGTTATFSGVVTSGGKTVVVQTGTPTAGHLASWNASGVLQDDGPLAWTRTDITSSQTFTIPAGTKEYVIEGWGAGASAAGGNTSTSQRGSGGGAGPYGYKHVTSNIDAALSITIGAGGAAVAASGSGATGNSGGTTTITGISLGTLTLNGGQGGQANVNAGGSGGTASGAWDFSISGQSGQVSPVVTGAGVAPGGSSPRGGCGGQSNVGENGGFPGGGGTSGNHTAGALSGAGANALVRIWTR